MKIFISGKITGEPILKCQRKFDKGVISVLSMDCFQVWNYFDDNGYIYTRGETPEIINPLHLEGIHFGIPHQEAMNICLAELKTCYAIYMLKDWKESEGAQLEYRKAKEWGKKVYFQK